jgi:hypothetical protein
MKGSPLNDQILNAIDEEILRLRQARAILTESSQARSTGKSARTSTVKTKSRRILSPKARGAIADAQRKRWAKVRSEKKPASPASAAKTESAAS